ncbi:MAG TPA: exopolysaccharide biosynthesis polyprenyl glycosylphosphotransferase [Yeosuana sp.]
MEFKRGRYSWLLRPILIVYDIFVINYLAFYFLNLNENNLYFFSFKFLNNKYLLYFIYSLVLWLMSTLLLNFYKVYRHTSFLSIIYLLIKQFLVFGVIVFAFVGVFRSIKLPATITLNYLLYSFVAIGFVKILSFYILKTFRLYYKGNIRNVIIAGGGDSIEELRTYFKKKKELGYNVKGVFNNSKDRNITGTISDCFNFLETNGGIDEIYCSIDELTEKEVNKFVKYANMNHCNIKFVPNRLKLYTKRLRTDYYTYIPVLSIQDGILNNEFVKFIKRSFDIVFSLFIIIFVLSWLSLILFILIKTESKGPLFYRHKRNGINYKEFYCYKYRSLTITQEIKGTYVKQDDSRVTNIGKFLRKTNLDELPQFINVLIGDMSVVGPRPHMLSYTEDYSKIIDKYNFIFRHHVKPGITGLAQIKGYRGEVETDQDIINRIKYDIFYIENWSLLLDVKIIFQTIINVFRGDEKAY